MKQWFLAVAMASSLAGFAQSSIFDAARSGDTSRASELLRIQPDTLSAKGPGGYRPLVLAAYYDQSAFVAYLLRHGVVIDDRDGDETALQAASYKGFHKVVEVLIRHGAPVNVRDANGSTALHYAAMGNHGSVIQLLMEAGANPNQRDLNEQSPLDQARLLLYTEAVELMERDYSAAKRVR
jgi:ankyrin repeat protein